MQEQIRHSHHCIHRCADLMAHVCKEHLHKLFAAFSPQFQIDDLLMIGCVIDCHSDERNQQADNFEIALIDATVKWSRISSGRFEKWMPEGVDYLIYDGLDKIPPFNDPEEIPGIVNEWINKIAAWILVGYIRVCKNK